MTLDVVCPDQEDAETVLVLHRTRQLLVCQRTPRALSLYLNLSTCF